MSRDRNVTPTARISREELAQLAEITHSEQRSEELEAVAEWEGPALAAGTPPHASTPTVSRTSTRHDPLTTEILAQIARGALDDEADAAPVRPTPLPSPHVIVKR